MSHAPHAPAVLFGGSRSLPGSFAPLVSRVVLASLARGFVVRVGCARGADQFAFQSVPGSKSCRLHVFCVGGASGSGFWGGSAFKAVCRVAARGAQVSWFAGGPVGLPLRARLLRRSLAALSGCSVACFFLASPSSAGSLRVAAAAAQSGVSVFAFSCGFSGAPAPLAGCPGSWQPSSLAGSACFVWRPAQAALF
jgi:hypothetical protein